MPIYEYECKGCNKTFEEIAYDLEDRECPECGEVGKRKISRYSYFKLGHDYPKFVDRIDDYQKRQVDNGVKPTLPPPAKVL